MGLSKVSVLAWKSAEAATESGNHRFVMCSAAFFLKAPQSVCIARFKHISLSTNETSLENSEIAELKCSDESNNTTAVVVVISETGGGPW